MYQGALAGRALDLKNEVSNKKIAGRMSITKDFVLRTAAYLRQL